MKPMRVALVIVSVLALAGAVHAADFVANCSGAEEVPSRETDARATGVFELSEDGESLHYKLVVANINNVVASHIHVGPAGQNGPVVAFLFTGPAPGSGAFHGKIGEGTITADLLLGPLSGMPLGALIDAMASGGAYVNVHTDDGVSPANTGAGDFPGGEVRGQIRVTD